MLPESGEGSLKVVIEQYIDAFPSFIDFEIVEHGANDTSARVALLVDVRQMAQHFNLSVGLRRVNVDF